MTLLLFFFFNVISSDVEDALNLLNEDLTMAEDDSGDEFEPL